MVNIVKNGKIADCTTTGLTWKTEKGMYFLTRIRNPSLLIKKVAKAATCLCQVKWCSKVTHTRLSDSLFSRKCYL